MKKRYTYETKEQGAEIKGLFPNHPDILKLFIYVLDEESHDISFKKNENYPLQYNKISSKPADLILGEEEQLKNYFAGPIKKEIIIFEGVPDLFNNNLDLIIGDQLTTYTDKDRNFHYFGIEQITGSLLFEASPNYNFYSEKLESLDSSYPTQNLLLTRRPSDFYAYNSIKIAETLPADEVIYQTKLLYTKQKYVDEGVYKNNFIDPKKLKGLFSSTLNLASLPLAPPGWSERETSFLSKEKLLIEFTNQREKVLPYNVQISTNYNMVAQNQNSLFKELLKDLNLYETFVYNLIDRSNSTGYSISDSGWGIEDNEARPNFQEHKNFFNLRRGPAVGETLKWALDTGAGFVSPKLGSKSSYEQDLNKYIEGKGFDQNNSIDNSSFIYTDFNEGTNLSGFDSYIFAAKLDEFLNNTFQPLSQRFIKDGKILEEPTQNYVEVLSYSVERYRVIPGENATVIRQFEKEFIIPASTDKEEFVNIIDAGVLYDQYYEYRFFCHVISVGTGIKQQFFSTDKSRKEVTTTNISYPDLRVFRVPLIYKETIVLDSFPVYPSAQIIPNRLDSSKIKLVFNDNVSGINDIPLPIFDSELASFLKKYVTEFQLSSDATSVLSLFETVDIALDLTLGGNNPLGVKALFNALKEEKQYNNFVFNSKSPIIKYQILRLDTPPMSYIDFQVAQINEINALEFKSYIDIVEPNKTYYYCFRSANAHGLYSNPSPVIEVQINDDGEIHTANIIPYAFPEEISPRKSPPPAKTKGVISVAFSEYALNMILPEDNDPENFAQNISFEKIKLAGREINPIDPDIYLKIRATSQSTERSIDLNFHPKKVVVSKLNGTGKEKQYNDLFSKGFIGSDLIELSNLLDVDTKIINKLLTEEEEFSVSKQLIQAIAEKLESGKLDKHTLQSLLANFSNLKSI